jgi:outer membrane autotransporter protein
LGLGNVTLNSGTLKADPQPINVKGNYIQNVGGTLQLAVDGPNAGQYDFLNVTGNASLNGTLALANGGYNPQANDKLTLVTTGETVSGKFAAFSNPFAHGTGYNLVDLVYGRNSVLLEFLNQTTPVSPVPPKVPTTPGAPPTVATINFPSFAQTPNQRAAASLLDPIQPDPKSAALMSYLYSQPTSRFPDDFAKISPEGLTAFYEISFSGANIQKLNLEGRLDDIRNGSNGFNSNVKMNGGSVAGPEGKTMVDGKYSKNTLEPILQSGPENRWGVWLTGFGDFVDVDSDSNAKGYDFTTGGVSLGVDYRIIDHLAIGVMANYSHTWTGLRPGHIGVDTGRGGIYATYFDRCFYLNGGIYGGYDSYDSSRDALGGVATGSTEGAEFSTFISGGYDFHFGHLSFGPTGSLQYTNVYIDGFNERNSLAPLRIHTDSEESLRTDLGFRAFYRWQLGKIALEPFLKAMWEHEFKYSALPITANLVGFSETSATFSGPAEGHDSAIVSAGVSVQWTPAISTYVNYDGQLGRDRYDSNAVTGGIRISF